MPDNIDISKTEFEVQFNYNLYDTDYVVEIHYPNNNTPYHIPYILVLPSKMDKSIFLSVEVNNLEVDNENELLENGLITARDFVKKLKGFKPPVLIPILPSILNEIPYYQQLSKECFNIDKDNLYYRIDLQILNIINEVKERVSSQVEIQEKIFLNGNPASMHDMSYFDRSVPSSVGYSQRKLYGKNLLERSKKQIDLLQSMGIDITQTIMMEELITIKVELVLMNLGNNL